jgi:hypothetical protein
MVVIGILLPWMWSTGSSLNHIHLPCLQSSIVTVIDRDSCLVHPSSEDSFEWHTGSSSFIASSSTASVLAGYSSLGLD